MRHILLGFSIIPSARTVYHSAVGTVGARASLVPRGARKIKSQFKNGGTLFA